MADVEIHEHAAGLTWVLSGEPMARASHALAADGRVWLVDPVDEPEPLARAAALGEVAGVVQLLDRHNRDGAAIAQRLGVALARLPSTLRNTPFETLSGVDVPKWREVALWWPETRTLVVPEAVGTVEAFAVGDGSVGVHPLLRLFGVGRLRHTEPELLLVGHGPPVAGPEAATALREALARSRSDLPRFVAKLPALVRDVRRGNSSATG
jgi:hypothetical protein